jgi:tetratricopeptide (TPR) repeat protein
MPKMPDKAKETPRAHPAGFSARRVGAGREITMRRRHPRLTALLLGAALCFGGSSSSAQESNLAAEVRPSIASSQRPSSDHSSLSRLNAPNFVEPRIALIDSRPFQQWVLSALLKDSNDSDAVRSLIRLDEKYPLSGTDSDARLVFAQVLRIAENALRFGDSSFVDALLDLAVLRRASGNIDGAMEIYRGVLVIRSAVLAPEASNPVQAQPSASQLSVRHSNELEGAEARFEREVEGRGAVFGSEPSEIASSLDELGSLHQRKGNFVLARAQFTRALAIREERLGRSHPQVATSLSYLANSYYAEGNLIQAEPRIRRALGIREKMLGPQHPEVASSLSDLAWLRLRTGSPGEAQKLFERALMIRERQSGPDHPDTLSSRTSLALVLKMCGHCAEARPSDEVAMMGDESSG